MVDSCRMRVLVIEDEKKTASFIAKALQAEDFAVDVVHNGDDALTAATHTAFDALVLDIMLPGRDGLSVLRQLRERGNATPVLLLSARGAVNERVEGLNAGADDYLAKPFALAELTARLRALGRRGGESLPTVLRLADLTLDTVSRRAQRAGNTIELTAREYRLLEFLLRVEKRRDAADPKVAAEPDESEKDIVEIFLKISLPAIAIALIGGLWLTRRALAPVAALTAAAEKIHERNLHERLPHSGHGDELDRLTEVFNAMTARLNDSFARIREFTLHASHELKTPLTVLHGELETALAEPSLPAPQRERLASQLEEIVRLTRIVDGLTLLTRAGAGQLPLAREAVRLDELVRDVFADAQILAQPRQVQVALGACEEISVMGDRHRLRQLLLNLADNAIKYNVAEGVGQASSLPVGGASLPRPTGGKMPPEPADKMSALHSKPAGTVLIELRRADGNAEFKITNTGPGLTSEQIARAFEPFFRGDASHQRDDGCGLGLSIARSIARAHGGEIFLESKPGEQTVVTVRLPRHDAPPAAE
ncbi:MAG: response regulator [Verrucomicrobia bacterium]|nr:response regulator [Verrucomicrobiota bacterium]